MRGHFIQGGDYKSRKYAEDEVVVDNPPFSILSEIVRWYTDKRIKFFLFAPSLVIFSSSSSSAATAICTGAEIIYENGAKVDTSFITNMEDEGLRARTAPDLKKEIDAANEENQKDKKRSLPKYEYPNEIVTAAMINKYSKYGVDFKLLKKDSQRVRALDAQKESGKAIYGSGYILSEKAAAEKWPLSDREKEIVRSLGK